MNRQYISLVTSVLAVAPLFITGGLARAQSCPPASFGTPTVASAGTSPSFVATADVDRDGRLDAVAANPTLDGITVLKGDGAGGFAPFTAYSAGSGSGPGALVIADFDGDGKPDVVTANESSNGVSLMLGDGAGAFGTPSAFAAGTGPRALVAADFNRDGKPDLAVANFASNDVSILLRAGSGFGPAASLSVGSGPVSVAAGDLNGDGRADLAVACSGSNAVSILLGTGTGTFSTASAVSVGLSPRSVVLADLDRDGRLDVATTNAGGNTVSVAAGQGGGAFGPAEAYSAGASPLALAVADVDRDGDLDLVATNVSSPDLTILLGDGAGSFGPAVSVNAGPSPAWVTTGDLNHDGRADLLTADTGGNVVSALLNTLTTAGPSPSFGPTGRTFPAGGRGFSIAAGDFNGDGITDLATANENAAQVSVLLGNGLGGYSSPVSSATGSQPVDLATGDFNGDGRLDLAVANQGSNTVRILTGSGSGTFPTYYDRAVGTYPSGVATGDLNRDGKLDVVVSNYGSANLGLLLGTGTGGLNSPVTYATGSSPRGVVTGDFDGNGTLDVAVANSASNTVSVLLGDGAGALGTPMSFSVGTGPRKLESGDFNGDGRPDLVTANFTSSDVSVLLGNGAGSFAPAMSVPLGSSYGMDVTAADMDGDSFDDIAAVSGSRVVLLRSNGLGGFTNVGAYAAGLTPDGVLAADLDSDGVLDVASSNANSSSISVYLGGPPGALRAGTRYNSGSVAHGIQLGDLNGDAILDAVALNTGSPYTVSTLLGNSVGGFGAPLTLTAGDVPTDHVLADLNRDGRLDLAVANRGGHNVSVFLGTGTGGFGTPYSVSTGASSEPRAVAVGDLNRDGALDLFVADYTGNRVVVFSGPFTTYFPSSATYTAGTHPISVSVGDLNRDGVPDVVTANYDQDRVSVLLGTAGGTGLAAPTGYTVTWSPLRVQIGDFNEDGTPDLAVARSATRNVAILLGTGAGAFGSATNHPIAPYAKGMSSLDFDGDGHLDLVVSGDDSTLTLLRGNGDGTFGAGTRLNGWAGGSPAVGDVDRNGSPDLVCADRELFVYLNTRARPGVLRITTVASTCNGAEIPLATQPVVSILDHGWNPVTCGSVPVTASLLAGTGAPGASLAGTTTVDSISGIATYSNLAVDVPGTAYRLRFESSGLDGRESLPIDVGNGTLRLQGPVRICGGTPAVFRASPGYRSYTWKLGSAWLSETGATLVLSSLPVGPYTLTVSVADICLGTLTTAFNFDVQSPATFGGASGVAAAGGAVCGLEVSWSPLGPGTTYSVYRSSSSGFVPWSANRVASCLTGGSYVDTTAVSGTTYWYVVRAENSASNEGGPCNGGCSDANLVYRSGSYTCAAASPNVVPFLDVTAGDGQNIVQWVNPANGGYTTTRVVAKLGGYPTSPDDAGALEVREQAGTPGEVDSWVHAGLANGTTVYYGAWVYSATASTFSPPKRATGRPEENSGAANPVKWAYSTGATAIAPPGVGSAYVASNDRGVHSMTAGDETVLRSGAWPPGWRPATMNAPAQGRPPVVPTSLFPGSTKVVFLGSQDGRVYAVAGSTGATLATSPVLGDAIQAGVAGMFTAFGGHYDLLFVGTRNTSAGNRLVALKVVGNALQVAWTFDNTAPGNGSGDGEIGIISGTAAVDYANDRVYFASRGRQGGSPRTLWCLSFSGTSATYEDAVALGDVDGSVTFTGADAFVGDNGGRVHSYRLVGGAFQQNWTSTVATGDGPIKRLPWVDFASGRIFVATTNRIWGLNPDGTAFWPSSGVTLPSGSTPSNPLVIDGLLYSGGDGKLFEYDATTPSPATPRSVQLGDPASVPQPVVGSPSYDWANRLIYVGTDAGIVYAVKVPLP